MANTSSGIIRAGVGGWTYEPWRGGRAVGLSGGGLGHVAERARTWASGGSPDGLARVEPGGHEGAPRDVYLYVISGHKVANPDAAMSLSKRIV
jgi:hypothetical protein